MPDDDTEAHAPVSSPEAEGDDADAAAGEDTETEAEETEAEAPAEVEIDFWGNKKSWPANTPLSVIAAEVEGLMKSGQADYTRKTQEIAEQRKALEAELSVVQKMRSLDETMRREFDKGLRIKEELAELEQVDLDALWQSNPDHARRVSDAKASKIAALRATAQKVEEYEVALAREEQQRAASLTARGREVVAREIKGFDDATEARLINYAMQRFAIPEDQAKQWPLNPAGAVMAYESMLYREMQAKAAKAVKTTPPPAAPVKPIATRSAPSRKTPDQMSDEEYYRWEVSQLAKRRA